MTIDIPPGTQESSKEDGGSEATPEATPEPSLNDLLWELLVGDRRMPADPGRGQGLPDADGGAAAKDHP